MSNFIFPAYMGTKINLKRAPIFDTAVVVSASGMEQRTSWQSTPRYKYSLDIEFLRAYWRTAPAGWSGATSYKSGDWVTYNAHWYMSITGSAAGYNINHAPTDTAYWVLADGGEIDALVQFILLHRGRWDTFLLVDPHDSVNRRVRFDIDEFEFERVVDKIWEINSIKMISVK